MKILGNIISNLQFFVKIDNYISPLMPYETKEFSINLHCEGLWEHKYGVRIVDGEVAE
ncbi:MAG: hypothetical protein ABIL15_04500 [candidate division WOR-3 bacterium]